MQPDAKERRGSEGTKGGRGEGGEVQGGRGRGEKQRERKKCKRRVARVKIWRRMWNWMGKEWDGWRNWVKVREWKSKE